MIRISIYVDEIVLKEFDEAIGLVKRSPAINHMMEEYIAKKRTGRSKEVNTND